MRLHESIVPSGHAYKVTLVLAQLGLPCEVAEVDTFATPSETRRPAFLALNPNGRIPLLELDDGTCLPESNAILWYLARGTPLVPDDRLAEAQVLQWMFFEQYSHEPYVAVLRYWTWWGGLDRVRPAELDRLRTRGQAALDVLATHLAHRRFLVGDRYTIADIALYAYTHTAAGIGLAVAPPVVDWLARVRAQPGHVAMKADPTGREQR